MAEGISKDGEFDFSMAVKALAYAFILSRIFGSGENDSMKISVSFGQADVVGEADQLVSKDSKV